MAQTPPDDVIEATFAFVDLAGFTAMTEAHGDTEAVAIVRAFRDRAREVLGPGDELVKTIGDAVMLRFATPQTAVVALRELLQQELIVRDAVLLPRAGAHHGPAMVVEGDYYGATVNLAARVAGQARGGQLLATTHVADAARDVGATITHIGCVDLHNVSASIDLYDIRVGDGVDPVVTDPVCQMRVPATGDAAVALDWAGRRFSFCGLPCASRFAAGPGRYLRPRAAEAQREQLPEAHVARRSGRDAPQGRRPAPAPFRTSAPPQRFKVRAAGNTARAMRGRDRDHPVVGRDHEITAFERAVARAADGQPAVVLVSGDPGIGKSTLLSEAARRTRTRLYLGRCVQVGGEAIPLAPLVDLIRQVQRETDVEPLHSFGLLSELATSGAGHVGDVFMLTLGLVGELGAEGPVIVGFDDLHWGDPATWDLFEHLARNLLDERVVLVGAYRTDELNPELRRRIAELSRVSGVERLTLDGLDRNAVAVQAAAVLGFPPPPSFVDELVRRGEGNPLFTEQLVAAHLAGDAVPALLSELIEADIASLEPAGRHVLAAVATVGRDTDPALLAAVVEYDEPTIESAVRAAMDARLLVVDATTDAYRVRHPLIGEVAYHAALPTERRRLHRAVATALKAEPRFGLTSTDGAGELAFHLDRGGDEAAAFDALFAAADSAELIAPATCLAHLERIFQLWERCAGPEHEPQLVPRLWQAADLASATGDNERAVALARRAFERGDPPEGRAWACERLARFLWSSGLIEDSAQTYQEAAALLDTAGEQDTAGASLTYGGLAQAELMFCRFDRAEHWARRALATADAHDVAARSAGLRVLGVVEALEGEVDVGLDHSRAAVDADLTPHRWALANAMLAMILLEVGHTEDALSVAQDGATVSQRAGFETSFGTFHAGVAARCLVRLGRWAEADLVLGGASSLDSTPIGAIQLDAAAAPLAARRGQHELAADVAERLRGHPADAFSRAIVAAALVDVHLAAKQWDLAVDIASSALSPEPDTAPRLVARYTAGLVVGTVERALDQLARREAVDLEAVLLQLGQRIEVARADPGSRSPAAAADLALAEAMITRLKGSDSAAFARAAAAAERAGDAWLAAFARLHEAEAAAKAGSAAQAADALRAAYDIATALCAEPLVEDLEALARRTRISLDAPTVAVVRDADAVRLGLTSREAEVLSLVAAGKTNREIGTELFVSEKTASVHVSNILRKLGVNSRVDAAAIAQRLGVS